MAGVETRISVATARPPPHLAHQRLTEYPAQGRGELRPDLRLLVGGKNVDNAVDGLGGILGVQSRENQVARFGGGQRDRDGLKVAQLTDQNDVGVLPQHVFECRGETVRVLPDFTLTDHAFLGLVHEFNRVFDRDNVIGAGAVDEVDDGRERGRFARTGRAGDEHKASWQMRKPRNGCRHAQFAQRPDFIGNQPKGAADRATLLIEIDAKAKRFDCVRKVKFQFARELLPLLGREDATEGRRDLARRPARPADDGPQGAIDTHARRRTAGHVQV